MFFMVIMVIVSTSVTFFNFDYLIPVFFFFFLKQEKVN